MRRLVCMLIIALLGIFASCTHKELCYDHSHVVNLSVKFDWSDAPDAYPESMSLYIFSEDGTKPQRYELLGREGGVIRLTRGVYHAVCLNSDTRNIECRNKEDISTFLVTTRDEDGTSSTGSGFGLALSSMVLNGAEMSERVAREPEKLWTGNGYNFVVEHDGDVMMLKPQQAVIDITISIYNAQNLRTVKTIVGTLSGLSEGMLAGTGERSDVCVTHPFEIRMSEDKSSLHANLRAFGDCLSGDKRHYIDLYVMIADGSQWKYRIDVTDEVHKATDKHHIDIVIDGLPVPEPAPGVDDGGFKPTIDDWNNIEQELQM